MAKRRFVNTAPTTISGNAPKDAVKVEFARRLQAAIIRKGWKQSDLMRAAQKHLPKGTKFGRDSISNYVRAMVMPNPSYLDALAKALDMTKEELVPAKGYRSAGDDNPPMDLRDNGDGNAWLRINRSVRMAAALRILQILNEEDGAGGSGGQMSAQDDGNSGLALPA